MCNGFQINFRFVGEVRVLARGAVGQYLHIIEGMAWVQERDGQKQVLKPGDTIYTAPGVEHWHGASPDSFMVHLAIWEAPSTDNGEPETSWGEHVTDEDYEQ
jgi:mannose-6-phosphate isomerase-like protein (cupin superfamily)